MEDRGKQIIDLSRRYADTPNNNTFHLVHIVSYPRCLINISATGTDEASTECLRLLD